MSELLLKKAQPLSCDIYENVTLANSGRGIIDERQVGAFCNDVALPQAHLYRGTKPLTIQIPKPYPVQTSTKEVIYGGALLNHYGHFLVESLSRLWYAKNNNLPIVWNQPKTDMSKWQIEILNKLGIKNEHLFINEATSYRKIHFPQPGFIVRNYCHPEHINFLGCYEEKEILKGKYVYFSRSKSQPTCLNEKDFESILQSRGWIIVYPEALSVEEQVDLLSTAEVCCMIIGSAQHTVLLTKNSQTRFIMLPRLKNLNYDLISYFKSPNYFNFNLDLTTVIDRKREHKNSFTLDIKEFERQLIETQDFTYNVENLPHMFTASTPLEEKHIILPKVYYDTRSTLLPEPLSKPKVKHKDNTLKENTMANNFTMWQWFSLFRYRVLTEVSFGKKHQHYKRKKRELKNLLSQYKRYTKTERERERERERELIGLAKTNIAMHTRAILNIFPTSGSTTYQYMIEYCMR